MLERSVVEFNWEEYLQLCKDLEDLYLNKEKKNVEAIARLIVNRAYYSSFRKISQYLKQKKLYTYDNKTRSKSSHDDLILNLGYILDPNNQINTNYIQDKVSRKRYRKIVDRLRQLKIVRHRVDYEDTSLEFPEKMIRDSISNLEKILSNLDAIENNTPYDHEKESK